jgi:hypothetical protein
MSFVAAVAVAAVGLASSAASAATIYASSVISFNKAGAVNAGVVNTNRNNAFNATGAPDSGVTGGPTRFYSLGQNKEIVLGFSQLFGAGPLKTVEVTFNGANPQEGAKVYVGLNAGPWTFLGYVSGRLGSNPQPDSLTITSGVFNRVKLVDAFNEIIPLSEGGNGTRRYGSQGGDGFDLDSVSVTPLAVPTPAAATGGLALLGLLAAKRRRQA